MTVLPYCAVVRVAFLCLDGRLFAVITVAFSVMKTRSLIAFLHRGGPGPAPRLPFQQILRDIPPANAAAEDLNYTGVSEMPQDARYAALSHSRFVCDHRNRRPAN